MSQTIVSAIKECETRDNSKTHVLKILCHLMGDEEIEFDPADKKQIEKAAKKFEAAKKDRGMIGHAVTGPGEAERIKEFDPKQEATVMSAPIRGGS
jgi:hypothetical protein